MFSVQRLQIGVEYDIKFREPLIKFAATNAEQIWTGKQLKQISVDVNIRNYKSNRYIPRMNATVFGW